MTDVLVLVDGEPGGTVPVTDAGVLRGDGCFEAIRSYDGHLFALDEHLDRLARSAKMLRIPLPARVDLERWCRTLAASGGEGAVRVVVSRGDALPGTASPPRCIVIHHPVPPAAASLRLLPVPAPWHPAGRSWELAGAKTLSYAPNLAAGRLAEDRGWDDALLLSDDGVVLEGPTFSVAWVVEGVLETPTLDLHILDSITRRHALAAGRGLGMRVEEGVYPLDRLAVATEAMAFATTKEVTPLVEVGEIRLEPGPFAEKLGAAFRERVAQEIRAQGGVGR